MAQTDDLSDKKYLELPAQKALEDIGKKCDRFGRIAGLLQEKQARKKELLTLTQTKEAELEQAKVQMGELLKEYGFADKEAYLCAKRSAKERELLYREIEDYGKQVAANNHARHENVPRHILFSTTVIPRNPPAKTGGRSDDSPHP